MTERIGVIGAGAWGTTLAVQLGLGNRPVTLWAHSEAAAAELDTRRENARYLPGIPLPPGLLITSRAEALAEPHRLFVLAVPSAHARAVLGQLGPSLAPGVPVVSAVKGIEEQTNLRMSELVQAELAGREVAALSGPNLAREIAAGKPAGAVVASHSAALAAEVAAIFGTERYRVYTNGDLVGVELCGALKNVVALAAGMVDGLQLGDSAKAGIITRGLAEMTRLGVAAGANAMTFAGLAGVGDLIATCMSPLSRNHRAGALLGQALPWDQVEPQLTGVAEGVYTVRAALSLAERYGVELPIAAQVDAVIHAGRPPLQAVAALMRREQKDELAGLPA